MKVESGVMLVNQPSPMVRVDPQFTDQLTIATMQVEIEAMQPVVTSTLTQST